MSQKIMKLQNCENKNPRNLQEHRIAKIFDYKVQKSISCPITTTFSEV